MPRRILRSMQRQLPANKKLPRDLRLRHQFWQKSDYSIKRCTYLGFVIDTEKYTVELTEEKRQKLHQEVSCFIQRPSCQIRDFAQLIGSLVATCPGVPYGLLYWKELERQKSLALFGTNHDYDEYMLVTDEVRTDLGWWKKAVLNYSNPIKTRRFSTEIFTDASTIGWKASSEGISTGGFWFPKERKEHINFLELSAVFLALKSFANQQRDCEILLRVDNTTAISYKNKMGGVRIPKFNKLAKQICQCESRRLWIEASYIASKDNKEADRESRINNIDTEWEMLAEDAYCQITSELGIPQVDLFASRINKKCDRYCSWDRDPGSYTQ